MQDGLPVWRRRCRLPVAVRIVVLCAIRLIPLPAFAAEGVLLKSEGLSGLDSVEPRRGEVDCIVVPEQEPWLLAVACPVAGKLRQEGTMPLLVASGSVPSDTPEVLRRVVRRRCLVLWPADRLGDRRTPTGPNDEVVSLRAGPLAGSADVAARFWGTSGQLALASLDDPEAVILASTLAAHFAIPLLVEGSGEHAEAVRQAIESLHAKRILLVTVARRAASKYQARGTEEVIRLNRQAAEQLLISKLSGPNVHNLVLARLPTSEPGVGTTAWLSPYVSLMRTAPVVLSPSADASSAEQGVKRLIDQYELRPRSVTILADLDSIGRHQVKLATGASAYEVVDDGYGDEEGYTDEYYEIAVEPCVPRSYETLATVGVGRIPFASLADASALFARGLVREYLGLQSEPMLMVANPARDGLALPLCETISRATAAEFKNTRIAVDEFYGTSADSPDVVASAAAAQVIIYEGHLYHQRLFVDDSDDEEGEYYEYSDEYDEGRGILPEDWQYDLESPEYDDAVPEQWEDIEQPPDALETSPEWRVRIGGRAAYGSIASPPPWYRLIVPWADDVPVRELAWARICVPLVSVNEWTSAPIGTPAVQAGGSGEKWLNGLPIVILQSCDSLQAGVMRKVHECGGVAVVGSPGHVHSASASSFVKALCDGALYRGDTLGEAIRDACNYLFCLQDLKNLRGHSQQAKSQRVAVSFQLWGDPELRLFAQGRPQAEHAPVSAEWTLADELTVVVPRRRLATTETEKYLLRMFPGTQVAGLVRRLKQRPVRRVTPVYFFRLAVPRDFDPSRFTTIARPEDKPNRAVFRVDPMKRFVYVLYYPDKEKPNEQFKLRFGT